MAGQPPTWLVFTHYEPQSRRKLLIGFSSQWLRVAEQMEMGELFFLPFVNEEPFKYT